MAWTVEILGMSGVEHWSVSDLPPLAEDQDRVVQERFPDVRLECESRRGRNGTLTPRRMRREEAQNQSEENDSRKSDAGA